MRDESEMHKRQEHDPVHLGWKTCAFSDVDGQDMEDMAAL
jgi:hypothetical protein